LIENGFENITNNKFPFILKFCLWKWNGVVYLPSLTDKVGIKTNFAVYK